MLGALVRWVEVSKYKVSNHCYISLFPLSPNIPSINAVPMRDHNKCLSSLDDVSISITDTNPPSASSISTAAYLSASEPTVLLLLTGVGSYGHE